MVRLSIIIPVYNSAQYLHKCINSLLKQDLASHEYEIIIVDDGSTDESRQIAESYVSFNKIIKYYTQKNKGIGGARNTGIQNVTGNYLMFVDSDDYIEEYCLAHVINYAEEHKLEVVRFDHQEVNEQYKIIPKKRNAIYAVNFKEDITNGMTYLTERMGWACYVHSYIFSSSFILKNKFFFEPFIYFEDIEWLPRVLIQAKSVGMIKTHIYNYLQRSGSVTKGIDSLEKKKLLIFRFKAIENIQSCFKDYVDPKTILWSESLVSLIVIGILSSISESYPSQKKEIINELHSRNVFPLKMYNFTLKQKLHTRIINISPALYCFCKKTFNVSFRNWK